MDTFIHINVKYIFKATWKYLKINLIIINTEGENSLRSFQTTALVPDTLVLHISFIDDMVSLKKRTAKWYDSSGIEFFWVVKEMRRAAEGPDNSYRPNSNTSTCKAMNTREGTSTSSYTRTDSPRLRDELFLLSDPKITVGNWGHRSSPKLVTAEPGKAQR